MLITSSAILLITTSQQHPKSTVHSSNQFSKNTKEHGNNIPVFIQQKKKISAQWPSQMPPNLVTKRKSNINLTRKNTASSNPQ